MNRFPLLSVMPRFKTLLISIALGVGLGACAPRSASSPAQSVSDVPQSASPSGRAVEPATPAPKPPLVEQADPKKVEALAGKLNDFSLSLYQAVAKGREGNLAVSPLGSFVLLEMLYEGSAGPAHDSLESILGRPESGLPEAASLVWLLDSLPSLTVAQKIFVDERAQIQPAYLQRVLTGLSDPVQTVPIARDSGKAVEAINAWVSQQTIGVIPSFLKELGPKNVCVLISALHFHGEWSREFPEEETKPGEFTLRDGSKLKVWMMRLPEQSWLSQFPIQGGQAVVLPYTDDTEMVLLLPDRGVRPDELWKDFNPRIHLGREAEREPLVTVELPRFDFDVPTFDLTECWQRLGLGKIVNGADWSPMLSFDPPAQIDLKVLHRAYIKVDEKGTVAAAVTALTATPASTGSPEPTPPPIKVIRFDRPFGFCLRHSQTGAVLMMGRVERPTEYSK